MKDTKWNAVKWVNVQLFIASDRSDQFDTLRYFYQCTVTLSPKETQDTSCDETVPLLVIETNLWEKNSQKYWRADRLIAAGQRPPFAQCLYCMYSSPVQHWSPCAGVQNLDHTSLTNPLQLSRCQSLLGLVRAGDLPSGLLVQLLQVYLTKY